MTFQSLRDVYEDFEILDRDGRWELIDDIGQSLEPMPEALKTDATQVPGCASKVWVYPLPTSNSSSLHFLADSNSRITKGIIALIVLAVQGKSAREILAMDMEEELAPFNLQTHFSSVRTSGIKNMIALIRETAERLAA